MKGLREQGRWGLEELGDKRVKHRFPIVSTLMSAIISRYVWTTMEHLLVESGACIIFEGTTGFQGHWMC